MNTVLTRLLQPTPLAVGLALVIVVAALAVIVWSSGLHDAEQLVGPFRWEPAPHLA